MKINQLPPAELPKAPGTRSGAAANASAPAAPAAPATPASTVTVSSMARSMETRAASGVGEASSDFNAAKVAQVKAAIAQGTYKVNAGAIADKLLSNAQQVLRRNASDSDSSSASRN